jgi:AP-3 complex subunit beta
VEVKKLVYMYLVHYADANATCRELALLAINSFQRDLSDPNQLIRALALRVLCTIRVREIVQIQLMSVKKCASDNSPYVRKTAAHSVGKIYQIDHDAKDELVEVVERLLGDKTTPVLSSAIQAFAEVCPERLDMLHPHYRKLCHLLADLDEWGQITAMGVLTRYVRANFTAPAPPEPKKKASPKKKKAKKDDDKKKKDSKKGKKGGKKGGKKSGFYSSDEGSDTGSDDDSDEEESSEEESVAGDDDELVVAKLPDDHELVLRTTLPLLRSRNSAVVLGVAALHQSVGNGDRGELLGGGAGASQRAGARADGGSGSGSLSVPRASCIAHPAPPPPSALPPAAASLHRIGRSLVRVMRNHREVQYVVLSNIVDMARTTPELFRRYLKDFYIAVRVARARRALG